MIVKFIDARGGRIDAVAGSARTCHNGILL